MDERNGESTGQPSSMDVTDLLVREHGLVLWLREVFLDEKLLAYSPLCRKDGDYTRTLALLLRDGVILCQLMLVLREKSIPRINTGVPILRMQFKRRENIQFFLDACTENGIPAFSLFFVSDLEEEKDPLKVMYAIFPPQHLLRFLVISHAQDK